MAAPFRCGLSNHRPYRTAEGAAALLSARQFNNRRDIPADSGRPVDMVVDLDVDAAQPQRTPR